MSNIFFGLAWRLMRWFGRFAAIALLAGASVQVASAKAAPTLANESLQYSLTGTVLPLIAGGALIASSTGGGGEEAAVAGLAIGYGGLLVGPSLGYFHGGCPDRAMAGIFIRAGIGIGSLAAAAMTMSGGNSDEFGDFSAIEAGVIMIGMGLAAVALDATFDNLMVKRVVLRHSLSSESETRMTIEPACLSGTPLPGIAARVAWP